MSIVSDYRNSHTTKQLIVCCIKRITAPQI